MGNVRGNGCVFCDIASGKIASSIVTEDDSTIAFLDLRQFHAGHTLVIPRRHVRDVRDLDDTTAAALMRTIARVTRAISAVFPNEGMSLRHSIGEAALQEAPHPHVHLRPPLTEDAVLAV